MNWTNEQKEAIFEKDRNILVAAAAGSGKTAVLVERIINKIINDKIDIDKILVVTFTNAAASEMRERILDAIYKKLEINPNDENLQRQITLIGKASICTIDSFCLEVIRNNFYELENISPNFRIADTTEIELLKQEIIEEIFEEKYETENKDFINLINTYTSYKDDTPLKDLVLKIYSYIQSNPFPEKWLTDKIEMFNLSEKSDDDFKKTIWGKILLEEIEEILIDDITTLQNVEEELSFDSELDAFQKVIRTDIDAIDNLRRSLDNWDKAYEILKNLEFVTWPRKKIDSDLKEEAKAIRDNLKKNYTGKNAKLKKILISDSKEANEDISAMYKILIKLKDLILEFGEKFSKAKREKNIVDFNDIEHLALEILLNKDEKYNIEKSDIAKKYQEKFKEIAIDEYQDSNLVQEYILTSVSNEKNIFMVGDIKQSIYKFRQAMPKLFLDKYSEYKIKEKLNKDDNLKIQLFKNFRSRDNVLNFTNMIFENIMSNLLGDIEYNEEEFLNLGAEYKNNNQGLKTEVNIINVKEEIQDDEEEVERIENVELEARFVANKIEKLVKEKFQVYDVKKQIFRDIKYTDIAILLRSTLTTAPIYEQELIKKQIPVFSDTSSNYLDSIEIETIISLLKIIDNPICDIPLVTVLRSNIGGFSDDDLIEIRMADKYDNFYDCLLKAKIQVDKELSEKIQKFINKLEVWRKEQEYLALDELIWKIYSDTGYFNYVGLMPNGQQRQANLKMLFQKAKQYETASFKGLYNFIKFIEKLKLSSGDMGSAKIIGENDNVVRIMSIHKSKGLEFPIVFLSSTGKQFNLMDLNQSLVLHQDLGIGVKYIDYEKQVEYDTLTKAAIKSKMLNENLSEEMRILYVALTRAKEKLIITGISKDYEKELEKIEIEVERYSRKFKKINPILLKKYRRYLDWIILVANYEKENFEKIASLNILAKKDILNTKEIKNEEPNVDKIITELNSKKVGKEEKEEIKKIEKILEYKYPNILATTIPTKLSVTDIKAIKDIKNKGKEHKIEENQKKGKEEKEEIFKKPNFMKNTEEEKITPAQKGTLIHLCMQKLNTKIEYDIEKINQLIENLYEKEIITQKEKQAIDPKKILEFTKSKIWQEMKQAKEIHQEAPFYINIPAKEIYKKDIEENILVQGIIDLYYINKENEIVLLDYKTDFVKKNEEKKLIEKYKNQLELYQRALEAALNKKVSKTYIYSVALGTVLDAT